MRGLSTTPTRSEPGQRGYRQSTFARLGGMRAETRHRPPPPTVAPSGVRLRRGVRQERSAEAQDDRAPSFTREDLLTADNVADILQIKRSTALDYMRRGVIPACKIGRRWYALRSRLDAHIGDLFDFGPYR